MERSSRSATAVIIFAVLCVVQLYVSPGVWAAPGLINYQGKLTNAAGAPITNPALAMKFRIYNAATVGIMEWGESQTVNVQAGQYSVVLGSGTLLPGSGSLDLTVFADDERYLEVEVNGEVLSPRQRITSVGYAFKAGIAEGAINGAITAPMISTSAVTTDKIANGAVIAKIKNEDGTGSGLDADLLDGSHASAFSAAAHTHDDRYYTKAQVDALTARIAALEAKLASLTVSGNDVIFNGVNVHVRNSMGNTATVNGTGNLIVGYNELRGSGDVRTGSHNIVVGQKHNYNSYGGLVAGGVNSITGPYASVSGGAGNTASGTASSVSGGDGNTAKNYAASVSGGRYNTASGNYSFVGGGGGGTAVEGNKAVAIYSAVLGGASNIAGDPALTDQSIGYQSSVSGGAYNIASGQRSFIGGGGGGTAAEGNKAFAHYSSILGGSYNIAGDPALANHTIGLISSVSGGAYNTASGNYSFIGGGGDGTAAGGNKAFANYSAVLGGAFNIAGDPALTSHLVGLQSCISGGYSGKAQGWGSSISGGNLNTVTTGGTGASISGGVNNTASGPFASISGGRNKTASADSSSAIGALGETWVQSLHITSDERLKENIVPIEGALEKVSNLRGVTFDWKRAGSSAGEAPKGRQIGLIAQEVEKVLPEVVASNGHKAVEYGNIVAVLVEAEKELKSQNEELKARIEALESKN
jgi:hypothetical protein